jgi:predicted transcriptional regulator
MSIVTVGVATLDEVMERTKAAFRGEYQGEFITFVTSDLLWRTLTPRRFDLIGKMAGKGPMSLRAAARLVGKDVKTVHADVHVLINHGVLEKAADGKIVFPYDQIHVDFKVPVSKAA